MPSRRAPGWALLVALAATGAARPALALSPADAKSRAEGAVREVEANVGAVQAAAASAARQRITPEQRIAAGELLLRNKDYDAAIDLLSQVVELHRQGKANEASNADASFLLAGAYFESKQYASARRYYRAVLDQAARAPYDAYAGRSLSRLVDIALHTSDLDSLDDIFARMNQLPASDASGSLQYAHAKAYFARHDFAAARAAASGVRADSPYSYQAQYLLGAVLVREATPAPPPAPEPPTTAAAAPVAAAPAAAGELAPPTKARYAAAIEQFRAVTRLSPDTDAHRHVIDLAWMAIGRLFYETSGYLDAADAYSHVDRTSPEFNAMLYELAWVYVRLGDYQRAQRALEVLSITDPGSLQFADGSLLRADLMLRSGQFEKALALYESVHDRFDPIRAQVDEFLKTTNDPVIYYQELVSDEFEAAELQLPKLSPIIIEWAKQQAEDDRAFALIDDVKRSRTLMKRSRALVRKLEAVLASGTRVRAFPELKAQLEAALGLTNKLAGARRTLAEGMDDAAGSGGGELAQVRAQRRALMKRMSQLPVTDGDFLRRESSGERQWNQMSQALQRLSLEADKLQAIVNGLQRVLKDADQFGVTRDLASRQRFQAEIEANEREIAVYRKKITEYREVIELGRSQIGLGDQRYVEDDATRKQFRTLFAREVELAASGQDGGDAQAYARAIQALLARLDAAEGRLDSARGTIERQVAEQTRSLSAEIAQESANLEQYAGRLDELDAEARTLVGEVAMRNFGLVRDRLKNIVLRADVGIVQEAWEVREEERMRVIDLQRERAQEDQQLNDELREVLDDAEESP
ncbi:MAG: tetratricopeptide repeat protein [Sorangiineae bacterium]|nr:tetratricopeptide repeat protein [Polyangiaceae bacterium]MEB2321584.1 tetratricopeptide repeat protein [Sorangiineae bacterium]